MQAEERLHLSLWQARVCWCCLQCPSFLGVAWRQALRRDAPQHDVMRALLGGHSAHPFAQRAQLLHAQNCVFQLVHLDVLQLVDVQAPVLFGFRDENDSDSKVLATGRVQTEPCEIAHGAITDEGVVADGFVKGPTGICDILDSSRDNLVAVVAHLLRLGFAGAGDKSYDVLASRAVLTVVDDAHAVVWVRLYVRQKREVNALIVLRAIVQDAEHARESRIGRRRWIPGDRLHHLQSMIHE